MSPYRTNPELDTMLYEPVCQKTLTFRGVNYDNEIDKSTYLMNHPVVIGWAVNLARPCGY